MKTKQVRFVNIDDWNRPVFKQIDAKLYYGSTEKLFPYEESEESVLKTVSEMDLTYFGEKLAEMVQGKDPDTAFTDLPFRAIPLYNGNPWFRPFVYAYFSMMDRLA